jgi:hypothetical protein
MDAHGNEDSRAITVKSLEGWKMVPVEPTEEMLVRGAMLICAVEGAGHNDPPLYEDHEAITQADYRERAKHSYRAMLSASPSPPVGGGSTAESSKTAVPCATDAVPRSPPSRAMQRLMKLYGVSSPEEVVDRLIDYSKTIEGLGNEHHSKTADANLPNENKV